MSTEIMAEIARVLNLPKCTTRAVITLDANTKECKVDLTIRLKDSEKLKTFSYNLIKFEPYDLNKIHT